MIKTCPPGSFESGPHWYVVEERNENPYARALSIWNMWLTNMNTNMTAIEHKGLMKPLPKWINRS